MDDLRLSEIPNCQIAGFFSFCMDYAVVYTGVTINLVFRCSYYQQISINYLPCSSTECEVSSDTSPSCRLGRGESDDVGERDAHDGDLIGRFKPRPWTPAGPNRGAEPGNVPFTEDWELDRRPTREIARLSISPEASRAIRNRASSAHNSQSPFWEARAIKRTTYSSMRPSCPSSSSSNACSTRRYPTAVLRESSFKACSNRSLGGGR